MTGYIIAAAVTVVIAVILLLRVGAAVEFSDEGLTVLAYAGFVKIKVFPMRAKKERRKPRERRKKEELDKKTEVKKPGLSFDFKKLFDEALKVLGKVRRRLLIKELTVLYVQAGGDPSKMAIAHGAALAALGFSQAALEGLFRVKQYNLHTSVDFLAEKPRIYVYAMFKMAVWEVLYIGFAGLMLILRSRKPKAKTAEKTREKIKG